MQGHIHQALVLTVFGNDMLNEKPERFSWKSSPAFRFSKQTIFVDGKPTNETNALLAGDPHAWFEWLKQSGVRRIWMGHEPENRQTRDYNTVAFPAGGGRWMLETQKDATSDIWRSLSKAVDKSAADKRIWSDTFYRFSKDWHKINVTPPDLGNARAALADILPKAAAFARAHAEKKSFTENFETGLEKLSASDPLGGGFLEELNETSLPLEARQLLGAASSSWVFGGMSWWNDGTTQADPEVYLALTENLWLAITGAIVSAANATP